MGAGHIEHTALMRDEACLIRLELLRPRDTDRVSIRVHDDIVRKRACLIAFKRRSIERDGADILDDGRLGLFRLDSPACDGHIALGIDAVCIRAGSGKVGVFGEKDAAVLRDADRRRLISGGSDRGCLYLHHRTLGDFDAGSLRARGGDLCIRQVDVRTLAVAISARRAVSCAGNLHIRESPVSAMGHEQCRIHPVKVTTFCTRGVTGLRDGIALRGDVCHGDAKRILIRFVRAVGHAVIRAIGSDLGGRAPLICGILRRRCRGRRRFGFRLGLGLRFWFRFGQRSGLRLCRLRRFW